MAGAQTSITLTDRLTGPLTRMMRAMDRTISIMEKMDRTANKVDTKGLQKARRDIQNAAADLERLKSSTGHVDRLGGGFRNLQSPVGSAGGLVRNFFASFAGAAAAILSIEALTEGFKTFVNSADAYTSTTARLSNINDGLQTQAELQEKVYQAAQRSRSGYMDLASSVSKLGLLAGEAFKNNDEMIYFGEMMGKVFTVSGASTFERQAGMYQLTQAMAAGKLQGDEFRSIMENAPMLAQAIADFTGKSKGELKEMSAEGTITADIIKGALFKAADDVEKKFKNMPLTFSDAMTIFKNWATRAFEPLFVRFSKFVNSDAFATMADHAMVFVNVFIIGMDMVFSTLEWFYTTVGRIGKFFEDNWSIIGPILTAISVLVGSIITILLTKYTVLGLVRMAILAWAAAQWVVNAAYLSNPITLVLITIVGVIALVIFAMIHWADQTASVVGIVAGLFAALGAGIWNVFVYLWNYISSFAEFFINVFVDPVYAVEKLFYDLSSNAIGFMGSMMGSFDNAANVLGNAFVAGANIAIKAINWVVEALNSIPGINLSPMNTLSAGSGSSFSNKMKNFAENLKPPERTKGTVSLPKLGYANMPQAFSAGNEAGKSFSLSASRSLTQVTDKISGVFSKPKGLENNPFKMTPGEKLINSPGDKANPTGGELDKIGKIEDKINIADEDLKLLLELADSKSIKEVSVTLSPSVSFGDLTIREEADIDKIVAKINKDFEDEMDRSIKGAVME